MRHPNPAVPAHTPQFQSTSALWEAFQGHLDVRRMLLARVRRRREFLRRVNEAMQWVAEKQAVVAFEDLGVDLAGASALLRQHEQEQRALLALEDTVGAVFEDGDTLAAEDPAVARMVVDAVDGLRGAWEAALESAVCREDLLRESVTLQRFLVRLRDASSFWKVIRTAILGEDVSAVGSLGSAVRLKRRHALRKLELDSREEDAHDILKTGRSLATTLSRAPASLDEQVDAFEADCDEVRMLWDVRHAEFHRCHQWHAFERAAGDMESWMYQEQGVLRKASADLGDSLDTVADLHVQHSNFEKLLAAKQAKLRALDKDAAAMLSSRDTRSADVRRCQAAYTAAEKDLLQLCKERRDALASAQELQELRRDVRELHIWIHEETKVAADEAYRDRTNLQNKIASHAAFAADVAANRKGIDALCGRSKDMVRRRHYAADEATELTTTLAHEYRSLVDAADTKDQRLREALEYVRFHREADDVSAWLASRVVVASSTNAGEDVEDCERLMKRFNEFRIDVEANSHRVHMLGDMATAYAARVEGAGASDVTDRHQVRAAARLCPAAASISCSLLSALEFRQLPC